MHLSQVHLQNKKCTCPNCTNKAKNCTNIKINAPLLCWCTSCSGKRQSRAETSAPPENCTNKAIRESPLGWYTSYLVGAVETTAPPGRVRGYGRDAIPSYNCTDWEGVLKYLCASVISVGEYLSKNFCEFGEFCGKIVWWQRGYGRMPYPPISAPPEEISLSTCLLVNLSTNKKKNYAEQDNTLLA